MFKLLKTDQLILEGSYAKPWVILRRTSAPWGAFSEIPRAFGQVLSMLKTLDRAKMGLLMDVRQSPINTDPLFERAVKEQLHKIPRFRKVVVLTQTAVGRAQTDRIAREASIGPIELFMDEEAALAYLEAP